MEEETPEQYGFRCGLLGRELCARSFETAREFVDWYKGFCAGRAEVERRMIEREGCAPAHARLHYNLRRQA